MAEINTGDLQRVEATNITNAAGVVTDPTALTLKIKKPDAIITTYTYGVDNIVVKDSVGNYHADIPIDQAGRWSYSWAGTGAATFAEGGRFRAYPLPTG